MSETPELAALRDVCSCLDRAGVKYMLTGSLAMSFYARPRMTRDVDLVVELDSASAPRLVGELGAEYHAVEWALQSRSEQQRSDVRLLLQARPDRGYLDKWAQRLDLVDSLEEAESE